MTIAGIDPKCYILALFVRDDGVRFLLGDDPYEFKDKQLHFQPNTVANDVVEVQGNDGYLLAGQVRRPGTQSFDGYVCNGTNSKAEVEVKRREFLQFFRRSHFYKVIYVFPNGTAIQRKQGFLVDDPTVQELYQQYPEYHVALNFEDVNYYTYEEDDQGQEIYAKEAIVPLAGGGATGGLIWDEYGVVWDGQWSDLVSVSGSEIQIDNEAGARAPIQDLELRGDTYQQTYSGKNLWQIRKENQTVGQVTYTYNQDGTFSLSGDPTGVGVVRVIVPLASSGITPGQTYTIWTDHGIGWGENQVMYYIQSCKADGTWVANIATFTSSAMTQTVANTDEQYIMFVLSWSAKGNYTNFNNVKTQLVAGSTTDSDFEPYTGGIPAPNPDYPQEAQTVTGEQTVTVTGENIVNIGFYDISGTNYTLKASYGNIKLTSTSANNSFDLNAGARTGVWLPSYGNANDYHLTGFGGNYTVSVQNFVNRTTGSGNTVLQTFTNKKVAVQSIAANATSVNPLTINLDDDEYIKSIYLWTSSSTIVDMEMDIQLEQGSTATSYESFQEQSYIIDLRGKNLLNISDFEMGGLSNGNPTTSSYRIQNASHPIAVQPNTTYTLSAQLVSPVQGFRVGVHECDATGSFISDSGWKELYVPNTFITGPNTYYLKMVGSLSTTSTNVSTGSTENTTACSTVAEFMRGCTLMLEKGSTSTGYEPYNPIELCKIGDYQDYIYKSGDDWYVHKEVGHDVADGNTVWTKSQYGANNYSFEPSPSPRDGNAPGLSSKVLVKSSCFNGVSYSDRSVSTLNIAYAANLGATSVIFVRNNKFDTKEDLTTFCASNPVDFYYALTTPTDTQITNATLIGQLDALGAMKLFIGENNLLVSATGSNLPATLEFSYPTKFAAIGAEWEEGGTKGATIVDVNAVDNTYPVWELMGPAVNPTISVLTTNTTLTYNGTITASQKLVIDMFNKTATLNGTSVIGNVSGDFVYMAPGTNRIAYTAGNTDAPDSTIYWQEVVG